MRRESMRQRGTRRSAATRTPRDCSRRPRVRLLGRRPAGALRTEVVRLGGRSGEPHGPGDRSGGRSGDRRAQAVLRAEVRCAGEALATAPAAARPSAANTHKGLAAARGPPAVQDVAGAQAMAQTQGRAGTQGLAAGAAASAPAAAGSDRVGERRCRSHLHHTFDTGSWVQSAKVARALCTGSV